jgi:hypothetical protein
MSGFDFPNPSSWLFYFDYAMCHHDIILRLHRLYFNYAVRQ